MGLNALKYFISTVWPWVGLQHVILVCPDHNHFLFVLFIAKPCPGIIPNGELSEPCAGTVGSSCGYSCHTGYQQRVGVSSIKCETSTNWSVDPHSLCTSEYSKTCVKRPISKRPENCV